MSKSDLPNEDVLDKLTTHIARMGTRDPNDYAAFLSVAEVMEAANEIKRLRERVSDLEAELEILEHSGGYGV